MDKTGLGARENGSERLGQVEEAELDEGARVIFQLWNMIRYKSVSTELRLNRELLSGFFVALILQETSNELLPRIALLLLALFLLRRWGGEHHARLDVHEGGCHLEILGRYVEVQRPHGVQIAEVLLGHESDRDVEDVQRVGPDHMEQEVERAFPLGEGHREGCVSRHQLPESLEMSMYT